jgi:putative heme iron utilization protein
MAEPITPPISDRICKHMNEDHASAVLVYAQVYGQAPQAEQAEMISIDPQGMHLSALVAGATQNLRVEFDRELTDSEDAHQMLIKMVKTARASAS